MVLITKKEVVGLNYINQIFERCNIDTISKFLIHGTQPLETNNNSLYDRNNKAYEKLNEWFTTQFPTFEEQNKHSGFVLSITYELESIYICKSVCRQAL